MDKIKKIWGENKVLFVLAMILIICFGVLAGVAIVYGYGTNDTNYESLAKIQDGVLSKAENTIKEKERVTKVSVNLKRKTVYISIDFSEGTTMDEAKAVATSSLEVFSEKDLKEADLSFVITVPGNSGFTLWGARNTHGSGEIMWGNYNLDNLKKETKEVTE